MVKGNIFIRRIKRDPDKITDDVNFLQDGHRDTVLTPRTEASSPESVVSASFNNSNITCSANSFNHDSSESLVHEEHGLQRHLSQTDDHIQILDRNGDLNEVAGSQSMLSQELIDHDHQHLKDDRSGYNCKSNLFVDLGLPEGTQSESSIGIAKRLGLLPQTQEEEEEATHVGERENNQDAIPLKAGSPKIKKRKNSGFTKVMKEETPQIEESKLYASKSRSQKNSDGHYRSWRGEKQTSDSFLKKSPLSGLELLTHVGIREAENPPSFSTVPKCNITSNDNKGISTLSKPAHERENEGFDCLLVAVAQISEQEKCQISEQEKCQEHSKKRKNVSLTASKLGSTSKQRKSETQKLKERVRREKIEQENEKAQAIAKKAAMIAERTITDPIIAKRLLLSMALKRENPRSVPASLPGKGFIIQEGFFWAHYPPLELILKKHMAEYYELSTNQCQSRQQQAFNNYMVGLVKNVAQAQRWEFADTFCDKSLRDRIRCYYKTHIQNAKKRLRTMVRNPTKRANARHLCEHADLIEKHRLEETHTRPRNTQSIKTETDE